MKSFSGQIPFSQYPRKTKLKKTYTKKGISKRNKTKRYEIVGQEVCKIAFLKTFQITQNRVDIALKKMNGVVITDNKGGKSGGKNKYSTNKVQE